VKATFISFWWFHLEKKHNLEIKHKIYPPWNRFTFIWDIFIYIYKKMKYFGMVNLNGPAIYTVFGNSIDNARGQVKRTKLSRKVLYYFAIFVIVNDINY